MCPGIKALSPPSRSIRGANAVNAETIRPLLLLGQQSDVPMVEGVIFLDHWKFHIEKITFLKTLLQWKFPQ